MKTTHKSYFPNDWISRIFSQIFLLEKKLKFWINYPQYFYYKKIGHTVSFYVQSFIKISLIYFFIYMFKICIMVPKTYYKNYLFHCNYFIKLKHVITYHKTWQFYSWWSTWISYFYVRLIFSVNTLYTSLYTHFHYFFIVDKINNNTDLYYISTE